MEVLLRRFLQLFFVLLLFNIRVVYSKDDSIRYVYFDYNITQREIDEHMFCLEYRLFKYNSLILTIGKIYPVGYSDFVKGISPDQDTWPFFVYKGVDYKFGYLYNFPYFNHPFCRFEDTYIGPQLLFMDFYIGSQITLKYMHYEKEFFSHYIRSIWRESFCSFGKSKSKSNKYGNWTTYWVRTI
jgi:hypothetical protein